MSTFTITLHDITLDQVRTLADVLGGETQVTHHTDAPAPPSVFEDAPTPPTAPAVASTGYPDTVDEDAGLDSTGLPWDSRIHAKTQTKTQKGAWKNARKVEAAYREQVEAELRACSPAPKDDAPAPPAPNPQQARVTFAEVMNLATAALSNGQIDEEELDDILETHGCEKGITSLINHQDKIDPVYAELKAYLDE